MRYGLFVFLSLLGFTSRGQQHHSIDVQLDSTASSFFVSHTVYVPQVQESDLLVNSHVLEWDLWDFSEETSILSQQLIHQQETDLHFSSDENRKYGLMLKGETCDFVGEFQPEKSFLAWPCDGRMHFEYAYSPPEWELLEQGRSNTFYGLNRPFLRLYNVEKRNNGNYWGGITATGEGATEPANLYGHNYIHPDETYELTLHNPHQLKLVVPGLFGIQNDTLVRSENAHTFFASSQLTELISPTTFGRVSWIFEDDFPPIRYQSVLPRVTQYLKGFFNYQWSDEDINILILKDRGHLRSAGNTIVIEWENSEEALELSLVEEIVRHYFASQLLVDEYKYPWLVEGFAHYHRYDYQSINYPESKLFGEYANTYVARFMDVDELKPTYLHHWLYLFMARQGLDQPLSTPALEYAPLNREAVMRGKAALWISMLRGYVGDRNYRRGLWRATGYESQDSILPPLTPERLVESIDYYQNRDIDWALGELYTTSKTVDYRLVDVDQCSYIVVARVDNRGELAVPFPTSGINVDGEPVLEQWHDGHLGTMDTLVLFLDEYASVTIDADQQTPDINGQNQRRTPTGLFQPFEPLRLQLYTGLDQTDKTQIFWFPSLKYNAYDGVLAGINFYNRTLMPKRWEYKIGPEYSTNTGQLTGHASLRYYKPFSSGPLHALEAGIYSRYFHYDEDLSYTRVSPGVNLHFRKSHPRSTLQHTLRVRGVGVSRELSTEDQALPSNVTNAEYWVTDLRYTREEQNILHPSLLEVDVQFGARFSKVSASFRQRYMLPNQQWMGVRVFAGTFIHNQQPAGQPFFSFGLSGTQDYLFDLSLIGRSDSSGIWSQQFFITDGGFKTATGVYSSTWMTSLSLNVPVWKGFGVFGDVGYSGLQNQVYWDYGVRLAIVPDFLEFYFPIQSSQLNHYAQANYLSQIRFVLNIDQGDIIQRLRRGWY